MKLRTILCLYLLSLLPALAEQTIARYLDLPTGASPKVIAVDNSSNLFVASSLTAPSGRPLVRVLKTAEDGRTLAGMDLDLASISAAAVTPNGTLVIAGSPSSTDFPLVAPVLPNAGPRSPVVVEIDSQLQTILFSTRLGGTTGHGPGHGGTFIGALAADPAGNLYVTGSTADTDFPLTPGAFQTEPPPGDPTFGTGTFAFLTGISADRTRLVFSTYFGGDKVSCIGGSHCIGVYANTRGAALGVEPDGDIAIAGLTTATNLPVTSGVLASQCNCTSDSPGGFAARFAAGGASLRWATYIPVGSFLYSVPTVSSMALDAGGNLVLTGTAGPSFPTSPGAPQPNVSAQGSMSGFIAKLDSSGQHFLFATYFGGAASGRVPKVSSVAIDRQGLIWITGTSAPNQLPPSNSPLLGPTYVAALSSDGSTVETIFTAPGDAAGQAIAVAPDGSVVTLGVVNSLLVTTPATGPSLLGVANSAGPEVSNIVAPFELVSLYGIGIGPATPMPAQVVDGVVTNTLGGVQVLFDGIPAPLLYAGPNQINAIVPQETGMRDTTALQIVTPEGTLEGPVMSVRPAQPAVFVVPDSNGMAAALNEDGSLNSATNPAAPGSIVSVWATGAGITYYSKSDGAIVNGTPGAVALPVSVLVFPGTNGGTSLEVQYAGDAPGLVAGAVQINFRLPQQVPYQGFRLQVGDALSPSFSIYMQEQ